MISQQCPPHYELVIVPCLEDNYAYLLHDHHSGETVLIDAPEAAPVLLALESKGWSLNRLLLTHKHDDHTAAALALKNATSAQIWGGAAEQAALPALDFVLESQGAYDLLPNTRLEVIDVPGHTLGHIAFHIPAARLLFSGDSLMVMGCGRIFEGTAEMMLATMDRLSALADQTRIYSGHEYTATNLRYALSLEPENEAIHARNTGAAMTMGASLALERQTNPFLRSRDPALRKALGFGVDADDAMVFARIREGRNLFR